MAMNPKQVLDELHEGKYRPIYFLQGEEPYFIDTISNFIEAHALTDAEKGFNQIVMYGKDSTVDAILTNARRFPMMSTRQVVLVKEAQEIIQFGRQDAQKLLQDYVENPQPSTVLVFCYKYKNLDKRRALTKLMMSKTAFVDSKKIYDDKIPAWITDYVRSKNATIDHVTAQLLSDYIGNNLERISGEIDKVLLNLDKPAKIDTDVIQKYVGISKNYNVFELQKALAVKDNLKAQRIVSYFAANPKMNPVIPIIAVLFGFFSKLLMVHHADNKSDSALARVLKVPPFFVKDYTLAASNYSSKQVIDNIGHLRNADLRVKGIGNNQVPASEVLKELVFQLIH